VIVGVGTDIIEVARIRRVIEQHGDRFLRHILTGVELDRAPLKQGKYAFFAGRWAAKEALAKALGTGIGASCAWTDIEVINNGDGKPQIQLKGQALQTAEKMDVSRIHVSISHEKALACAVVILEQV